MENKHKCENQTVTKNNERNQILFNNNLIKKKKTTLYFKAWIEKGIKGVIEIIQNKALLTLNKIQEKIGHNIANTIFEYGPLVNAIPIQWKNWIRYVVSYFFLYFV